MMLQLQTRPFVGSLLLTLFLTFSGSIPSCGQANFDAPELEAKDILNRYVSFEKAVLDMSREEWEVIRAWDGFDEERYLTFLHDYKDSFAEVRGGRKAMRLQKINQDDPCGCWVEPDDTYIRMVPPPGIGGLAVNEMAWSVQGGAGWNVDCASDAIPVSSPSNPWAFELYGDTYNFFYVNSKGQISFGGDVIDWTPTGFPAAEYNQIAGYWQDLDIRSVGEIMWKRTNDAVYVNFVDVGYYNNQSDLTNSFQIIITYPGSGVLPDGNNAQLCYLDMNWSHGDVGGSNGCCGADPGVAGADSESTNPNPNYSPHVQLGRFNLPDDTYNGPYGIGEGNEDGINWLDYKSININTAETNNNLAPLPTTNLGCDTLAICLNQTTALDVEFLGPEPNQLIELSVNHELAGDCEIVDTSMSNGVAATYSGTFVANSPGISTVTLTATDSEGATTVVDVIVEVLDIVPPELGLSTSTGSFGICAGAELVVTAASNGGDESVVQWSWFAVNDYNESASGSSSTQTFATAGNYFVAGATPSGCVVEESFEVIVSPLYLPTLEGTSELLCPGDSALVEVIPDPDENFVDFVWVENWNGGGGQVLSSDGGSAYVTPGLYQVVVSDEEGCDGKRTFAIGSTSTIPDQTIDPLCGAAAFDPVTFDGGYSSLGQGYLQLQLFSSLNGWEGSFLSVDILHEDGTVTNSAITLSSGGFANVGGNEDLAIAFGDEVQITYVSNNPANDQYFSLIIFNCVSNCNGNPDACTQIDDLSSGVIYSAPASCPTEPILGTWEEVSGLGNNSFSVTDQYNTTWLATAFGLYDLCFTVADCPNPTCYQVEVNEAPTITLSGDSVLWVCDEVDQLSVELEVMVSDPAGAGIINWPFPGNDNVLENEYTFSHYANQTIEVIVQNGCGHATDQMEVTAVPEPQLNNEVACGLGAVVELDPIEGDQNTGLVYEWWYNGNPVAVEDNEWIVDTTGTYCVSVPIEGCHSSFDATECAFISYELAPLDPFELGFDLECALEETHVVLPDEWFEGATPFTVIWPDGSDSVSWTVSEGYEVGSVFCLEVFSPNCYNESFCGEISALCVAGCTNPEAFNFNPEANVDDGSCDTFEKSCNTLGEPNWSDWPMDLYPSAMQFLVHGVQDSLSWALNLPGTIAEPSTGEVFQVNWIDLDSVSGVPPGMIPSGWMDQLDANTQACVGLAGVPQEPGVYAWKFYLTAQLSVFGSPFLANATVETGITVLENPDGIPGCTYMWASNFQSIATLDDGSCVLSGCLDVLACNYNPNATQDSGACEYGCQGCTYLSATNYSPDATLDDGSCTFESTGACIFDINNDGEVGTMDLLEFLTAYGTSCTP